MTLTKNDIVETIHTELEFPKSQAVDIIEILLETMKATMTNGEDIMISGFGKFNVKEKNERKGRNPATGENMILEKRRVVTFKCAKALRDRVNGG